MCIFLNEILNFACSSCKNAQVIKQEIAYEEIKLKNHRAVKKDQKKAHPKMSFLNNGCIVLASHQVPLALLSPLTSLTSEFGMGSGISSSLSTHPNLFVKFGHGYLYLKRLIESNQPSLKKFSFAFTKQNQIENEPKIKQIKAKRQISINQLNALLHLHP